MYRMHVKHIRTYRNTIQILDFFGKHRTFKSSMNGRDLRFASKLFAEGVCI